MNKYKGVKINGKKYDEHRVIACATELGADIVVHHVDGNKMNNSIENLEIMTRSEHCIKHGFGIDVRPQSMAIFEPTERMTGICRKCGKELPWDCFPADKNATHGRRSACKTCTAKAKQEWRLQNI